MCRRCGERDKRGSARDRRRRKQRLIERDGNGTTVMCHWQCGTVLTIVTVEQDRLLPGGPYRLDNLVPACGPCNRARTYRTVEIPDGCEYGPVDAPIYLAGAAA